MLTLNTNRGWLGSLLQTVMAGLLFTVGWLCPYAKGLAVEPNPLVPAAVTFERDVMSVLSKSGCNAGTCHGNINGKGGFFLSLRGQDPEFDYQQFVLSAAGRRIDPLVPSQSLALLKATADVAHQGGKRFGPQTPEYAILERWIEQGCSPPDSQAPTVTHLEVTPADTVLWGDENELQLSVIAHFSDNTSHDVTRLAVYEASDPLVDVSLEGVVRFQQPGLVTILVRYLEGQFPVRVAYRSASADFQWRDQAAANFIDEAIYKRLRQLKLNPAAPASDHVFVRRVYLDLLGILPTAEAARQFVADSSPDKRTKLIDQLIERPEFAESWALKWSDVLRNEEKTLDAKGVETLHRWIRDAFAEDRPLNTFASELIAGRGSTYENPPANYWRAHREPLVRAETTAQVFLGVRLQCAKCHNHPFDRWSQDEYYQWASLFAGIDYEIVDNKRRDDLDKHEFVGEQIVLVKQEGNVKNARTGQPAEPRLLDSNEPVEGDRLQRLAAWVASPENKMFARAQANRVWYHMMGVGLVEPVDDLRPTNPASHPELLDRLAEEFAAHGYSVKHLVRVIANSQTYQAGSELDAREISPQEYAPQLFARAVVHRLSAEQILDAQSHVLGLPAKFEGYEAGTRAGQLAGVERVRRKLAGGDTFLRQFGKPERLLACECERSNEATLGQALSLIGGDDLHQRLTQSDNRIGQLLAQHDRIEPVIDELFWTSLSRPPTEAEQQGILALIESRGEARPILEDVVWALLNAKELLFRN